MAEAHVVAICVAVAALALAAAVLGVVGEATKSKAPPSSRSNTRYVRFDSDFQKAINTHACVFLCSLTVGTTA